jgi:hypothetical protein
MEFINTYALISTSTPEGKSNLLRASTVLEEEVKISNKRLCVANWNCSRLFLFACGERNTVKMRLCVGKGIGPVTTAPVLRTVFTIFSADLSTFET